MRSVMLKCEFIEKELIILLLITALFILIAKLININIQKQIEEQKYINFVVEDGIKQWEIEEAQ